MAACFAFFAAIRFSLPSMCKVHKDTRCEVTASECVGWCVGPFYYTYTAQHSNVTALLVTLPPIQHVLGLVRRCIRASFGLIMAAAEWDLCLLFDRPSEGWSMPRLSLDELYSGCQSLWQEAREGAGRDYKIQFRAREGVDLLYKVAPRCPPPVPPQTQIHNQTGTFICCRIFSLFCVSVVIPSKTENPYLS